MAQPGAVLVVKLGALGDFVQAIGPFAAIRRHHEGGRIVLLTTAPYVELADAGGWFDAVWTDTRPGALDVPGWLRLRRRLREGRFARVYDLQTSDRSSFYYRLFWPGPWPEWSGIARGCSHPHANAGRDFLHTLERQREQLAMAGIPDVPAANLAFAEADVARFALTRPYALLVPGGAAHRPGKRWPAERYAALARHLAQRGTTPVLVGGGDDAVLAGEIVARARGAVDLAGRTSLLELAQLARSAALAVGNDTGPMHLIALAGCPSLVLYSHASDPALCAPRGPRVAILRKPRLAELGLEEVEAALAPHVAAAAPP